VTESRSLWDLYQVRCFPLLEDGSRASCRNVVPHWKLDDEQRPKTEHHFKSKFAHFRKLNFYLLQ